MNFFKWIKSIIIKDPIKSCDLYKEKGCAHVDGILCNCGACDLQIKYNEYKHMKDINNLFHIITQSQTDYWQKRFKELKTIFDGK